MNNFTIMPNNKLAFILRNRFLRRFILVSLDLLSLLLSACLSFSNHDHSSKMKMFLFIDSSYFWIIPVVFFVAIPFYFITGQYKALTRFLASQFPYQICIRNLFILVILINISNLTNFANPTFTNWLVFWIISTALISFHRMIFRDMLSSLNLINKNSQTKVIIYGAGKTGADLAFSIGNSGGYKILSFFDDDSSLWGRTVNGIPIMKPSIDLELAKNVDQVLLAIPSLSRSERSFILNSLNRFSIPVYQVPGLSDLTSGRSIINDLIPISIEDLLARKFVDPIQDLIGYGLTGSVVLIAGAGGSIGSEICLQIIRESSPKSLLLFDISETSLYNVTSLINEKLEKDIDIIPILGNACSLSTITRVIEEYKVNTIFHAAAYKHVPLVESNIIEGIYNNVFSTYNICKASISSNYVKQVLFISTDKAVRPTNIMGASKRLGELIMQGFSQRNTELTSVGSSEKKIFSMVRFGNVLGSSGSVVPLFEKQIKQGGPITITHKDIIRYFMTIQEAAQLVLQSLALSKGGDIFLLDMGKPVKITYLAEQMIALSGLTCKNEDNPDGDIEIKYVGLRPGEKLYEELLISLKSEPTVHPLIYKALETLPSFDLIEPELNKLKVCLEDNDEKNALKILKDIVPDWNPNVN